MQFDYYYGNQADQFSFIKIPKIMMTGKDYAELSLQAKVLYGLLLDRMSLSMKNGWLDKENRVYIIYQIAEIQEDLGFSKKKAIECLSELEEFGIVEKQRRGLGLPTIIYVKSFVISEKKMSDENDTSRGVENDTSEKVNSLAEVEGICQKSNNFDKKAFMPTLNDAINVPEKLRGVENDTSRGVENDTSRGVENDTSRGVKNALQEVPKMTPLKNNTYSNNTNINNTDINNTIYITSNHIISETADIIPEDIDNRCDKMREVEAYRDMIRQNIDYDILVKDYPNDREMIEGIVDLMLEIVISKSSNVIIASNSFPTEVARSRMLKLNMMHIQYVMECLKKTSGVKNIKKYILATLFNAPVTVNEYYFNLVNDNAAL